MLNSESVPESQAARNSAAVKAFAKALGVDLVGVAHLRPAEPHTSVAPPDSFGLSTHYPNAIVLGVPFGKLGRTASGTEVSLYLEKVALEVLASLEGQGQHGLIIHTEDEIDPAQRLGLLSLKVLAKAAGLGWQGRSLLIVSPVFGPVHRWIAVLTSLPLEADVPVSNNCGHCSICVDSCPHGALTLVAFADHPSRREDVLDIRACKGDDGCDICLAVCPWARPYPGPTAQRSPA